MKNNLIEVNKDKEAFVLVDKDRTQLLQIAWDVDREGYGMWKIRLCGLDDKGFPIKKTFKDGTVAAAFYGEVAIVGVDGMEMFSSFGFSDEDLVDFEGQVCNKPMEVHIRPHRED